MTTICIKTSKAPVVQSRPQKDVNASIVQDNRRRAAEQQGVYGNIFTSALGDAGYGSNVATYGGKRKAA